MKKIYILATLLLGFSKADAQETLQTVTERGNTTNVSLQIGGTSVNANTTKLFIRNPFGKNFALSAGANMISENGFHIYNWTDNQNTPLLSLTDEGNMGVGISGPKEKLAVNGTIRAKEIKVENAEWPDYVFMRSYQLPTLQETEAYIKKNGHLPGIPSASEVKTNGIGLGEMNAKLLKKIEELTLHLIEKDKEINTLKRFCEKMIDIERRLDELQKK